jgi:hypothetical protein
MENLPDAFMPMREDLQRLDAILELLDENDEAVIRADLAAELVGVCARCEDVKQRVVYPAIESHVADHSVLEQAERDQARVREALGEIRGRTHHVKPAYVHVDDPEGFEAALGELVRRIRTHLAFEEQVLFPILAGFDAGEREELRAAVEQGVAHASSAPSPPQGALARAAGAVVEKLDHLVEHDESTAWHPGIDKLDETIGAKSGTSPRQ